MLKESREAREPEEEEMRSEVIGCLLTAYSGFCQVEHFYFY